MQDLNEIENYADNRVNGIRFVYRTGLGLKWSKIRIKQVGSKKAKENLKRSR